MAEPEVKELGAAEVGDVVGRVEKMVDALMALERAFWKIDGVGVAADRHRVKED